MHFLRSHFSLVSSSLFPAGLAAVAVSLIQGSIGPWQAAELSVYGVLLVVLVCLARNLGRLRREVWSSRLRIDGQGLECGELTADDRADLVSRMDELLGRMSRAAELLAGRDESGCEDRRERGPMPIRPADVERGREEAVPSTEDRGADPAVRTEAAGVAT